MFIGLAYFSFKLELKIGQVEPDPILSTCMLDLNILLIGLDLNKKLEWNLKGG